MTTYKSGDFKLSFTPEMIQYLKEHQRDFMPEDTKAGMIQAYLDRYTGSAVCSKPVSYTHLTILSIIVEISVFRPEILLCGYTAQGTKIFYDTGSSSMDYSNRMTGLYGICSPAM